MSTTTTHKLPKAVIQAEKAMTGAGFDSLAAMRWHWTANPDNDEKVSQSEYARQTGVSPQAVSKSVRQHRADHGIEATRKGNNTSGKNGTDPKADTDDEATDNVVEVAQHQRTKAGDLTALAKAVRDAAVALHKAVEKNGSPSGKRFHDYVESAAIALAYVLEDEGHVVDSTGALVAA